MNRTGRGYEGSEDPTGRMVTADVLRSMTFSRAPLTRRGYVEDEVHLAISRAATALAFLAEENVRLRAEMQRHRDWIRANNISDGLSPTGVPGVDAVLQHARAQQVAEQTVSVAREQARSLVQTARAQAEAILQRSWEQAAQAVAQSGGQEKQEEVDRLITYLRRMAESLVVAADEFTANRGRLTDGTTAADSAHDD